MIESKYKELRYKKPSELTPEEYLFVVRGNRRPTKEQEKQFKEQIIKAGNYIYNR